MTLCTEVAIDMYRSSLYRCTEVGTPDVPKWSCTDLALPHIAQVSLLHLFWIIQHAEYQTLLLQKREGVYIWLVAAAGVWLAKRHEFGHYDQLLTELHKKDK